MLKRVFSIVILAIFTAAAIGALAAYAGAPSGIISWCAGDIDGDGRDELLVVAGSGGRAHTGERCGDRLLVCDISGLMAAERGDVDALLPLFTIGLADYRPMKVQLGDINGDGVNEIALCMYKTAKFHDTLAKRPFFFAFADGGLVPVWLGSRLSRPFDDYVLSDINSDGMSEIVAIELLENGGRVVCAYNWKGFGFEVLAQSGPFAGKLSFLEAAVADGGDVAVFAHDASQSYIFRYDERSGCLEYSKYSMKNSVFHRARA